MHVFVLMYTFCNYRNNNNCTPLHLVNEDSNEILNLLDPNHLLPRMNDPVLQEYVIEVGALSSQLWHFVSGWVPFKWCDMWESRYQTLFCYVLWLCYCVLSTVMQHFRYRWAHMSCVNSWILNTFTQQWQHIWAPPLMEVLHYSASNVVIGSKY